MRKASAKILFFAYVLTVQMMSLYMGVKTGRKSRFSVFFDMDTETELYKMRESSSEIASLAYLREKMTSPPKWHADSQSQTSKSTSPFCITIITKQRPNANYIIRSGAYLLSRLETIVSHDHPLKVYITNANRPSNSNTILSNFGTFVDIIHLQDLEEIPQPSAALDPHYRWMRQHLFDSALIFSFAQRLSCSHLMILEDDGIVSRNFYPEVITALKQLDEGEEYFSLKLFYSDTFSGWSVDPEDILLFLGSTLILSFIIVGLPVLFFKQLRRSPVHLLVGLISFWVFYLLLFQAVGKQSLFPEFQGRGLMKIGRHMGAIVGVVYPQRYFPVLESLLRNKTDEMGRTEMLSWEGKGLKSLDLVVDDFADKVLDKDTFLLLPNCVQHIGRFSSAALRNQGSLEGLSRSNSYPVEDEDF